VQANAPQERLHADKGFRAVLRRGGQQPVSIWGEQLNYSAANKRSTLQKKILVVDRGTRINASKAEIDHAAQRLFFGADTVLARPDTTLTADELTVDLRHDIFTARGNVRLTREAEQTANELRRVKTQISADALQADVAGDFAQMTLSGNVLIRQAGKQASGRSAIYNEKENLIYLSDGEYTQEENAAVVKAQKIIVDIAAEKFTAAGAAEAAILLPRKQ
jgi:lipopolysaccharide export system protein LptA